jgi:hypothetical protein
MNPVQRYPNLDLLPVENICLHEHHDPQRTLPLMERIRTSQMLYNPPLVIQIPEEEERHMVLDGANRVTAMKEIGLPHILVQRVDPETDGLSLQTWNHILWNIDTDILLSKIEAIDDIHLEAVDGPRFSANTLALIEIPDQQRFALTTKAVHSRSEVITELVRMYSAAARFDRTMIDALDGLNGYYEKIAGLIIYPPFRVSDVVNFCREDKLLPAGITRFIVSPRALRVNYPLANFSGNQPLEEKRNTLQEFIRARMEKKGVRIYTETTVLYDE